MGIKKDLGQLIEKLRLKMGLSQVEFGRKINPPKSGATVSRWENGEHMPKSKHMDQILDLADENGMLGPFLALESQHRYKDILNAESYARRIQQSRRTGEVRETYEMGEYTIHLLADGSLLVDGLVHVFPQ